MRVFTPMEMAEHTGECTSTRAMHSKDHDADPRRGLYRL